MKIDPNTCYHGVTGDCVYCAAEGMHGFQAFAKGVNLFYKRFATKIDLKYMMTPDPSGDPEMTHIPSIAVSTMGVAVKPGDVMYLMALGWNFAPEVGYWTFTRG